MQIGVMIHRMGTKLGAIALTCGLLLGTSAAAPAAAPTQPVASVEHQEANLTAGQAEAAVANTPRHAEADTITWAWESCALPITVNYSAGPGVSVDTMLDQLVYPVRYLQELGYSASIGTEVPYTTDPALPAEAGTVLVVATLDREDLPSLRTSKFRAWAENGAGYPLQSTARIDIDANRGLSSLVILHELGHVVGLPHKEETVMSTNGTSSSGFDAAETAAIDCRF